MEIKWNCILQRMWNKMVIKVVRNKDGNIKSKKIYCGTAVRKNNTIDCNRKYKSINEDIVDKIVIANVKEKLSKISKSDKLENLILNQYNEIVQRYMMII